MTNAERIAQYLDHLIALGQLHPGDRLPKYADIAEMFHIPYISVQRAFKTMEYEGKIKIINGIGSFLNGGDELPVDFYVTESTFDLKDFQVLVQEISNKHDLHLAFTVKSQHGVFLSNTSEHKAIITESDPWMQMDGSLLDYSAFEDYQDVRSELIYLDTNGNMNLQLPFYVFTYQGIINPEYFHDMNVTLDSISDFSFWDELVSACRNRDISPAAISSSSKWMWNYPLKELSLILMLQQRTNLDTLFQPPFYNHPTGQKILRIASECTKAELPETCFFHGKTAMLFFIGSWFSVQRRKKFHADERCYQIIPLRQGNRHLLPYLETYLKTFINATITKNERQRLWTFLKILSTKKYQKRVCALSGALSSRKDMKPGDYAWNTRPDFTHFFPQKNTLLINKDALSPAKLSVLSYLYELYGKKKIAASEIGEILDGALGKSL